MLTFSQRRQFPEWKRHEYEKKHESERERERERERKGENGRREKAQSEKERGTVRHVGEERKQNKKESFL